MQHRSQFELRNQWVALGGLGAALSFPVFCGLSSSFFFLFSLLPLASLKPSLLHFRYSIFPPAFDTRFLHILFSLS